MNSPLTTTNASEDQSQWPIRTMLLCGTFGTRTGAERRFILRSILASVVVVGWGVLGFITRFRPRPFMIDGLVLLAPLILTYTSWEWGRYMVTLDELARRILCEAAVRAYCAATQVAVWIVGIAVAVRWPHYPNPKVVLAVACYLFVLLVTIMSGFYLRRILRRY